MCSSNSITEILGIREKNLEITGNNYENIKGIISSNRCSNYYMPTDCNKCACINKDYSTVKS